MYICVNIHIYIYIFMYVYLCVYPRVEGRLLKIGVGNFDNKKAYSVSSDISRSAWEYLRCSEIQHFLEKGQM